MTNAPARQAWFCPACKKYHAPHCDSCPSVNAVSSIKMPVYPSTNLPSCPPNFSTILVGDGPAQADCVARYAC